LHDSRHDRYELFGPGFIHYEVAGTRYRVGHLSFFQVNRHLIEEMVGTALGDAAGALALDLFAGAGLFSVPLARRFTRVVAVESNPAALRDLEANAAGLPLQAVSREVEEFLKDFAETPDFALLDPPRAGVATEALKRLVAIQPARITYVSCDPATLGRDLAELTASAYAIAEVHLFDVFPQTYHIETIVRLHRRE